MSSSDSSSNFPKDEIYERLDSKNVWSGNWKYLLSADQINLIDSITKRSTIPVEVGQIGSSQYNLPIQSVRFGNQKGRKVVIWARQHGDEPECSGALNIALLEILAHNGNVPSYKKIIDELDILVIPMINPGGTNLFTRESVVGIDLNRDAAAQVTPEADVLIKMRDTFKPEFAFNLHDMNPRKHVEEGHPELVTLAFQAGPFDETDQDNEVRSKAKTIIGKMIGSVESRCKHIAKYKANFMGRAFGDSMMKWGVACVLIESGSLKDVDGGDEEVIRLHTLTLLSGLYHVAVKEDTPYNTDFYQELPYDAGTFDFDESIRNGEVVDVESQLTFKADVGIQKHVLDDHVTLDRQFRSNIAAVGDLSVEYGAQDFDANGCLVLPGSICFLPELPFKDSLPNDQEVRKYLEAGITTLVTSYGPFANVKESKSFLNDLIKKPSPINMVVFEKVSSIKGILNRFGATEFRGFCLEKCTIDLKNLLGILGEYVGHIDTRLATVENVHSVSFFLVGGSAPSKRHLHICIGDEEPEVTSNLSLDDLQMFLKCFSFKPSQVSFSRHQSNPNHQKSNVPLNYLYQNDSPATDYFSTNANGLESKIDICKFFHGITSAPARSLRIQNGGHLHVGSLADIVAYPYDQESNKLEPPRYVFLNGECVVNNEDGRYIPRLGRWFIST